MKPAEEQTSNIALRQLETQSDADAFRSLNEEWITRWFHLEETDRLTLNDPCGIIVNKGGQVFIASVGDDVVGCAALINYANGIFELSKMAVSPSLRGQGVGRQLLLYVIVQARTLGARTVFLGSSTRLANAVHLYESVGFRHVSLSDLPPLKYERADVFMKMNL